MSLSKLLSVCACVCVLNAIDGIYSLDLCRINSQWMAWSAFGQTFNVYNFQTLCSSCTPIHVICMIRFLFTHALHPLHPLARSTFQCASIVFVYMNFWIFLFHVPMWKFGEWEIQCCTCSGVHRHSTVVIAATPDQLLKIIKF